MSDKKEIKFGLMGEGKPWGVIFFDALILFDL